MGELRDRMEMAMRLRNFSSTTIKCYIWQVKSFTRMFGRSPAELGEPEVQQYVQSLVQQNKSWSSVRLAYSALRFLYRETLGREWDFAGLPPAKREKRLPVLMSMEDCRATRHDGLPHERISSHCHEGRMVHVRELAPQRPTSVQASGP